MDKTVADWAEVGDKRISTRLRTKKVDSESSEEGNPYGGSKPIPVNGRGRGRGRGRGKGRGRGTKRG